GATFPVPQPSGCNNRPSRNGGPWFRWKRPTSQALPLGRLAADILGLSERAYESSLSPRGRGLEGYLDQPSDCLGAVDLILGPTAIHSALQLPAGWADRFCRQCMSPSRLPYATIGRHGGKPMTILRV